MEVRFSRLVILNTPDNTTILLAEEWKAAAKQDEARVFAFLLQEPESVTEGSREVGTKYKLRAAPELPLPEIVTGRLMHVVGARKPDRPEVTLNSVSPVFPSITIGQHKVILTLLPYSVKTKDPVQEYPELGEVNGQQLFTLYTFLNSTFRSKLLWLTHLYGF